MIEITNTESGESTEGAYEMVPEGTLDMIEAKDKRIAELEARIAEAQKDLRMAALSDDCVVHLSAYLGAISHALDGGADN